MAEHSIRRLSEFLQHLGYPRPVDYVSFTRPNFALVADILLWLFRRFEPHTQISVDISTKPNRVEFLRTIARQLLTDYWLTIDTEALYCAEAASASELLKLAELLHAAYQDGEDMHEAGPARIKTRELQEMAARLDELGAALKACLLEEPILREKRHRLMEQEIDIGAVEARILEATGVLQEELAASNQSIADLAEQGRALQSAIQRQRAELEGAQQRLRALSAMRPPHSQEQDRLRQQLQELFQEYHQKMRNVEWLEAQIMRMQDEEAVNMSEHVRSLEQVRLSFQVARERMLMGEQRPDTRDIDSENDSQMSSEDGQEANFGSMPIWSVSDVGPSVSSTGN